MNSISQNQQKPTIASFLTKTMTILQNPVYRNTICWDSTGKLIQILNQIEFEEVVLPKIFKHKKIKSFIRQLNMYGFKKANRKIAENSFYHPCFYQNSEQDLKRIKRRKNCRLVPITGLDNQVQNFKSYQLIGNSPQSVDTITTANQLKDKTHNNKQNIQGKMLIKVSDNIADSIEQFEMESGQDRLLQQSQNIFYDMDRWNCNQDLFPSQKQQYSMFCKQLFNQYY